MTEHQVRQLELLRGTFPELEVLDDAVRLPAYPVPVAVWGVVEVDVCFRLPAEPAVQPYGFWVHPELIEQDNIASMDHYQGGQSSPFSGDSDWGFFSWSPTTWSPSDTIITFVRSFAERLAQR